MSYLYDPTTKENPVYDQHIHSEDPILPQITWQSLIDTFTASYGHDESRREFKQHIKDTLEPIFEDMWFEYELCKAEIMREVARR